MLRRNRVAETNQITSDSSKKEELVSMSKDNFSVINVGF